MNEDFKLIEPALLGKALDELRESVAFKGHRLAYTVLCKKIGMSRKTYKKMISGVAGMQAITCEC